MSFFTNLKNSMYEKENLFIIKAEKKECNGNIIMKEKRDKLLISKSYYKRLGGFSYLLNELEKKIGKQQIDILIDKAQNGVEVRLLYDAVGSRLFSDKSIHKLKKSGVKVGAFFPSFMKVINFNLNYRNHRKIVVIDGNVGFIGGNNIGDEYLGKDPKFGYWRDTHLKITGDSVKDLNIRFILDWRYTTKEDLVLDKYFALDGDTYLVEYLDLQDMEGSSSQIRDIFRRALKEGEVELALEADAVGLLILESAKEYEIFKKKNIFVVKNGRIEKFKACLC